MKGPFIALIFLPAFFLPSLGFAATPMDTPLPDDSITRIECEFDTTTYHYDLYVPDGYESDTDTNYPVLFIFSPGGNATMGNMESWLKDERWLAVMLVESKNGPWDPIIENFSAAYDDLVMRVRVQEDRIFLTGVSGGARASSYMAFNEIRPGLRGIFLQAAGSEEVWYEGRYRANLFIYASFGDTDFNLPELGRMDDILPESIFEHETFSGGHEGAPAEVAERALDWLDSKVKQGEYGVSGRFAASASCLPSAVISTDSGQAGDISKDHLWYVVNGLTEGNHTLTASATGCKASPAQYQLTVPPDASGKNFALSKISTSKSLPFTSLLLNRKPIFEDDLSNNPNVCYLDCAFSGNRGWRSVFSFVTEWRWAVPSCGGITAGYTGNYALSYNPLGNYYANTSLPRVLMSPVIDCTGFKGVQLEFWRWLEVEGSANDTAKIEVTNGDGNWHTIWSNPPSTLRDTEWNKQVFDISPWADNQSAVTIRWVMGPTNPTLQYCGWNIDDIRVTGR